MKQLIATLPYPPSVNRTWRQGRGRIYLAKNVIEYRILVSALLFNAERFGSAIVDLHIKMFPPDRRRRDLDNTLKAIFDSLQCARVIDNDCQIRSLHVEFGEKIEGGKIEIVMKEFV